MIHPVFPGKNSEVKKLPEDFSGSAGSFFFMSFPSGLICGDRRDDGRHDAGAELLCNDAGAEEAESHTPVWVNNFYLIPF